MANGFGSLYVGASALKSEQNALNVVANNLSNVNTTGYVRQQVVLSDTHYTTFGNAAISSQTQGQGVQIADVVHTRDIFLDSSYRSESGRQAFYAASYEAVSEVETLLQETQGEAYAEALSDLYEAFAEFAKDPSDTVNQNLVMQKASLYVSRTQALYTGFQNYQSNLNQQIEDDVDRINEIGNEIQALNKRIQQIESAGVETASDLRDTRDALLDELSSLADISYKELYNGIVTVNIENVEFVTETQVNEIAMKEDKLTGFSTPYWPQLSDTEEGVYVEVFNTDNAYADNGTDKGEVKALLLARGDSYATYLDMLGLDADTYESGLANSIMLNSESELDTMFHSIVTAINDILCPNTTAESLLDEAGTTSLEATLADGTTVTITADTMILDEENACVGSDGTYPPHELFTRIGCDRYTEATVTINGEEQTIYLYNEEDTSDISKCYSIVSTEVNEDLVEEESLIPYKTQNGNIGYDMAAKLEAVWDDASYTLNPSDETPCSFTDFYTKWVGEIATVGSIYSTTADTLEATCESIEDNRQSVIGVSSDEELTNMIRYQQGYNAASRYINVVNEMIEYLLTSLT